jgi:Na+/citrate or Na+/malate symporter
MKKVLSTIVAALVAISFAGIVCAADVKSDVKSESTTVTPAGEVKTDKKEVKKSAKTKKAKKVKKTLKKEETTTEPAPAAK